MPPELTPPPRAEYSSNRNTRKARQRKLALTGAAKVEEAARNSDYKAMIYVRKKVAAKDEYKNASDLVKDQMLQQAMAEAMEARSVITTWPFAHPRREGVEDQAGHC